MSRRNNSTLAELVLMPWWINVIFSAIAYVVLRFVLPSLHVENPMLKTFFSMCPQLALPFAGLLLVVALLSFIRSLTKRREQSQGGAESGRVCPRCGRKLVRCLTRRGPRAGSSFMGCSGFSSGCRYTEDIPE